MKTVVMVAMVICLSTSSTLMAQIHFRDGGTYNISSTISNNVWIDYQAPGKKTTVNLLNGGYIPSPYGIAAYSDSLVNVLGGSVGSVIAYNFSQITVTDGSLGGVGSQDGSQVILLGGSVGNAIAFNSSKITINGGLVNGSLLAYDSNQITLSNGTVAGDMNIQTNSQLIMNGGLIFGNLYTYSSNYVTLSGGSVSGDFYGDYDSKVIMTGGSINGNLFARINTQVLIEDESSIGGSLYAYSGSQIAMTGGLVGGNLYATESGQITISGFDFAIDGIPCDFGKISSILGDDYIYEPSRRLSGILANGDLLNNQFQLGYFASINLVPVPEPASFLALAGGVVGVLSFRRRR